MTPLQTAVQKAIERLGEWLADNTEGVFEEEPEIDTVRADLDEALRATDSSKKPRYRAQCHSFAPVGNRWVMQMTIEEPHKASGIEADTYGHTSAILSIDFENGIVETRNSIYLIGEP